MRKFKSAGSAAILVGLLASAAPAPAQAQQPPGWIADPRTGCRLWNNYPGPDDRITWDGPCVGGFGQGHGILHWFAAGRPDDEVDDGDFAQGKLEGHGVVARANGRHFDGQFHDNKPNGQGTLRDSDGKIYTGIWVNGCFAQGNRRSYFFTTATECSAK
ncbi:MAG TPA: hypothetical protein VFC38_09075 [Stellaceae bacterium]|nr:hypothetical protein [Stellaceae bacterium]